MTALALGELNFRSVLCIPCEYEKYKLTDAIGGTSPEGTRHR